MNKTALITGASSGIGLELADLMASKGINLVLAARSIDKLENAGISLKEKYGIDVLVIQSDLSRPDSPDEVYKKIREKKIEINYLVNNAGFGSYGPFIGEDADKISMMIDLNIKSLTRFTRLFASDMAVRGEGRILNVASVAAFQPGPLMAVYYATKAFVLSFTQAVAKELEDKGVTLTVLCPGPTATGFKNRANLSGSPLFESRKSASARSVAVFGYNAMIRGKRIAIHGFVNKVLVLSVRFIPSGLVTDLVMKITEKRKSV